MESGTSVNRRIFLKRMAKIGIGLSLGGMLGSAKMGIDGANERQDFSDSTERETQKPSETELDSAEKTLSSFHQTVDNFADTHTLDTLPTAINFQTIYEAKDVMNREEEYQKRVSGLNSGDWKYVGAISGILISDSALALSLSELMTSRGKTYNI